jgi:CheY-like chemotaxis protein
VAAARRVGSGGLNHGLCAACAQALDDAAVGRARFVANHAGAEFLGDLGLPGLDGFEFISWVRRLGPGEGGETPAAAITSYTSKEDGERARSAGFQIQVGKPLEVDTWIRTVERLLGDR